MAANRKAVVDAVAAQDFPWLFSSSQYNTHENCAKFLVAVCDKLAQQFPLEKWGLLTKNSGENGYTWPNGKRTSHDAICLPNGERIDIVGAAGDTNLKPSTSWNVIPPEHWRPHNVWMDYREVVMDNPNPNPNPPNPNPPEDILTKAARQVDENNRFLRQVAGIWNLPFPD